MIKRLFITFLLSIVACATFATEPFHFNPFYNFKTPALKQDLQSAKTNEDKFNILFSLAFNNNQLVESPAYIDTAYLNQLIALNQTAQLFDSKPFVILRLALREGVKTRYHQELLLLQKAVEEFDQQHIQVPWLLITMRWMFNIANQQPEKYRYYSRKLSGYLQSGQNQNAAACYHCIAGYFSYTGDNNQAINNYMKAGEMFKPFSNLWYIHEFTVIGAHYNDWGNSAKGLYYLRFGFELQKKINLTGEENSFIGQIVRTEYDLKHYQKSLDYLDQTPLPKNEVDRQGVLIYKVLNYIALGRLAEARNQLSILQNGVNQSELTRIILNSDFGLNYAFYKYYQALGEKSKAEYYLLAEYDKVKKDGQVKLQIKLLKELEQFYGDAYEAEKAWQYGKTYNRMNDSLHQAVGKFNVASYENERKESEQNKKLAVQEAVISQRNTIIWVSLIGLMAVLGSLVFISRQLRINKRNLNHLKTTQAQLIQSEKMASLGELTAGIAHEIQNPLNFVNNFSEVNREMISELKEALQTGDIDEARAIANDIDQNEERINHHGKRADGIVKGMLEHSRSSTGQKEPVDLNKLADEYLRLAHHGMRAKDKIFYSAIVTEFDPALPPAMVIPQDIGRVLLNLFNNAFYAVQQQEKVAGNTFKPEVKVSTSMTGNLIRIQISDNGTGIPDAIKDKIMQPFFTTKPTGEGTGLGLSLSYDIVTKGHGGTINIKSEAGKYSEFEVLIPADLPGAGKLT